ncbi:MAG: LysM peptidoglycan-binding domain-containing protein [Bacteroidales bacterium]|nr:LysM peptidoglycan-binding domain-containing protein [Bacteroidales bacterium]
MRRVWFVLLIVIIFQNFAGAQEDTLTLRKAEDKVMIGGKIYYVHIVKKGETLYSLSKLYNVSQKEIAKENPEIFLGLQVGQALKIPVVDEQTAAAGDDQDQFIYHQVKKGQTLYSLSKKYDVSLDDLIICNPDARYGINVGEVLKIPKSKSVVELIQQYPKTDDQVKDTVPVEDDFIYHTVAKKETIYSLTRTFDLSYDDLIKHNPFLTDGLKAGQTIKIPKKQTFEPVSLLFQPDEEGKDTSVLYKERTAIAYSDSAELFPCDSFPQKTGQTFNVAVLLPFYLDKNDEEFYIDSSEVDDLGEKIYERVYYDPYYIYPRSLNFVEFYEGFLLAVDRLKESGLNLNLYVYDTANDTARVKEILNYPMMENMDLLIGPIYNQELKLVSEFSKEHQIKMVSPLWDNLQLVDENPFLFQVTPSYAAQIDEYVEYITRFKDKNLVLVHNGDSLHYDNIQMVKDKLFAHFSDSVLGSIQFKEVVFKDSINVLEHAASKEVDNVFVVPSNEEAFVTSVVTNLNTLAAFNYPVKVCGLSRWQRFRNIDTEYYFNLNLCISTPYFVDYQKDNVKDFILEYRETYNTEPQQYAIHGFDIGMYFLSALLKYGNNLEDCIYYHQQDLLQADYHFVRWYKDSGFENIDVSLIEYRENYNISKIEPQHAQEQTYEVKYW